MSDPDDDEDATRMMSRGPLRGGAAAHGGPSHDDDFEEVDPDATVPLVRGASFGEFASRVRPAAGAPAIPQPAPSSPEREMADTGELTLPRNRDSLPLAKPRVEIDTGEHTLPRARLAPPPPLELPPPAYRPPPAAAPAPFAAAPPMQGRSQGSVPPPVPFTPSKPFAPSMPVAPASMPPSAAAAPQKVRSPPVFVGVMVACTVLTITGLVLLFYLKVKGLW